MKPDKLRRSPRNHSPPPTPSPAKTPDTPMRHKLSYTSAGRESTRETRNTPTEDRRLVRRALGDTIKQKLDDKLLSQHFRDANRFFKIEEYRHYAYPICVGLHNDPCLNTSMYSKKQLFKLAVNIAKKRDFYVPKVKPKLNQTKKRKNRAKKRKKSWRSCSC